MKGYWIAKVNVLHPDKQKMYAELASMACLLYTSPSPRDGT